MSVIEKDIYGEPLTESYEDFLIESLKDPEEAKAYLNAALEDGDYHVFLLALRDIADALGMTTIAKNAGLNRENIYRMLSEKGNPTISSLFPLLRAIQLRLSVELAKPRPKKEHSEESLEAATMAASVASHAKKYTKPEIRLVRNSPKVHLFHKKPKLNYEYQAIA